MGGGRETWGLETALCTLALPQPQPLQSPSGSFSHGLHPSFGPTVTAETHRFSLKHPPPGSSSLGPTSVSCCSCECLVPPILTRAPILLHLRDSGAGGENHSRAQWEKGKARRPLSTWEVGWGTGWGDSEVTTEKTGFLEGALSVPWPPHPLRFSVFSDSQFSWAHLDYLPIFTPYFPHP